MRLVALVLFALVVGVVIGMAVGYDLPHLGNEGVVIKPCPDQWIEVYWNGELVHELGPDDGAVYEFYSRILNDDIPTESDGQNAEEI